MKLPEYWLERTKAGRFPNAVLLSGEERVEAALELSAAYLCEGENPPCHTCRHCRKVEAGIHPDLMRAETADSVKVDPIRALRTDAYIRPNEAKRKVYLLSAADSMNPNAQNALLKLLEEGPEYACFFFLVANPETLLPTLRSRCETLRCEGQEGTIVEEAELSEFIRLLLSTKEQKMPLLSFCVSLEKKNREEWALFLDRSIGLLAAQLQNDPAGLFPKLDALKKVRAACEINIGSGHLSGLLMASLL